MSASVVLVAAGHGKRFGPASRRPKQFKPLLGKPLLYWPLRTFQKTPAVKSVVLVLSRDYLSWAPRFLRREGLAKVSAVVEGGRERADSVRNGARAVPSDASVVLVHDAARALVTPELVERVIRAAEKTGAALAAWPVSDTIKRSDGGARVRATLPRKDLWLAQTPQGFRRDVARKIFFRRGPALTDDVQWAERAGLPVELVAGSSWNFKVTYPEDFKLCEAILRRRKAR
jgi:2-C-methyl-D-erythritol 4-phosphate cytidylyltransferase